MAKFIALLLKEPLIPGPDRKRPKASLKDELTKVKYSLEANTKPKFKVSDVGTKSNSIAATSLIELIVKL